MNLTPPNPTLPDKAPDATVPPILFNRRELIVREHLNFLYEHYERLRIITAHTFPSSESVSETNKTQRPILRHVMHKISSDPRTLPYGTSEGYTPFGTLLGFGLAQGAALTAVAKGEQYKLLVLSIYFGAVIITLFWVINLLRATKETSNGKVRAYDQPSIQFGRWTLLWTIVQATVMLYLGYNQLLPNQTRRNIYDLGLIRCKTLTQEDLISTGLTGREREMDKWLEWLKKRAEPNDVAPQFFWIEQETPFPDYYRTFPVRLDYNRDFVFTEKVAFLVKGRSGSFKPVYRQIDFLRNAPPGETWLNVEDPDLGETIVILLYVWKPESRVYPTKTEFQVDLVPGFESTSLGP